MAEARSPATWRRRAVAASLALVVALPVSACGSGGGAAGSRRSAAAYEQCLAEHGFASPTARPLPPEPSQSPAPEAAAFRKARRACAKYRPSGGLPAGGLRAERRRAFLACLADHGVSPPTPTATASGGPGPSDRGGMLSGLDRNDPVVARALAACREQLRTAVPTSTARPSG